MALIKRFRNATDVRTEYVRQGMAILDQVKQKNLLLKHSAPRRSRSNLY